MNLFMGLILRVLDQALTRICSATSLGATGTRSLTTMLLNKSSVIRTMRISPIVAGAALAIQSCARSPVEGNSPSIYAVGDFEDVIVMSDDRFINGSPIDLENPVYYLKSGGKKITRKEEAGFACLQFAADFALAVSKRLGEFRCSGMKFKSSRINDAGDVEYYGYCLRGNPTCPEEFTSKPLIKYLVNKSGKLLSLNFDPTSDDSRPYLLKRGAGFELKMGAR